jgi:hypothetical protein
VDHVRDEDAEAERDTDTGAGDENRRHGSQDQQPVEQVDDHVDTRRIHCSPLDDGGLSACPFGYPCPG